MENLFENQDIVDINIEDSVKASYLDYSMSVIIGRALPDAKDGLKRIHPTQKPIYLYRWILNRFAKEGFKILDTHGGSMTIAHACDKENFDLDICELDKEYFEAGLKRYNEYKQQLTMF